MQCKNSSVGDQFPFPPISLVGLRSAVKTVRSSRIPQRLTAKAGKSQRIKMFCFSFPSFFCAKLIKDIIETFFVYDAKKAENAAKRNVKIAK